MTSSRFAISPPVALLTGAVLMFLAVAASLMIMTRSRDGDVIIVADPSMHEIAVEITGAVRTPGVYRLPQDARLADLLAAAGGANADADLSRHNLARRLQDAEQIVISARSAATPVIASDGETPDTAQSISYKVNINSATQAELESLPGIGPVLATRIIEFRTANGQFRSTRDLTRIEGISDRLLSEIVDLITLGP